MRKVAIVLFNLGGPDSLDAIQPFLFNLFNDPAIIGAPGPIRVALAQLLSRLRAPKVAPSYRLMGGASPLTPETQAQADALVAALAARGVLAKAFLAMRYWTPFVAEAARAVNAWEPDEVILLPLYPQFSTTTTASSLKAWAAAGGAAARLVCCYPSSEKFLKAHASVIHEAWAAAGRPAPARVLFSAHGLPQKVVDAGDPYQRQVEETVAGVAAHLDPDLQVQVCYQSRVGPLAWIGPSTEDAIEQAARDAVGVIVSPIAFVSEHIETLVELDVEYRDAAQREGVPFYLRARALGVHPLYIEALADLVETALGHDGRVTSAKGGGDCGAGCGVCPRRAAMR